MFKSPFVETSISRSIFDAINVARDLGQNVSIVGEPGIGKTRALNAYASDEDNFTHIMTATAVTGNALRDLFRELADVLGIHVSGSMADMQRQMFKYEFYGQALIIDEAQNLKLQSYRELLHLWDFTGLCLIFAGNGEVLRRTSTTKGAFAQIGRRVKFKSEFNSILDDDADRLAASYGIDCIESVKLLREIGADQLTDGVCSVLQIAQQSAGIKAIRLADIREADNAIFPHRRRKAR